MEVIYSHVIDMRVVSISLHVSKIH